MGIFFTTTCVLINECPTGWNHADQVKEYKFLSNAEDVLEKISSNIKINYGDSSFKVQDIEQLSLNKSILNC